MNRVPSLDSYCKLIGISRQTDLEVETLSIVEHAAYSQRLIAYTSPDEERIQAFLLVPHNPVAKVPGILAIHQDGSTRPYRYGKSEVAGLAGDPNLKYGLELCLRGYVVLCPDRFPHESRSLDHSQFKPLFDDFRLILKSEGKEYDLTEDLYRGCVANQLSMRGWTLAGRELSELLCAVDCLCLQPEVDTERIGVIGHSAGGGLAASLMYIDPRIKVGCASCGSWLTKWTFGSGKLRPINGFGGMTPGVMAWGDMDDILAGLAPRPFLEARGDAPEAEMIEQLIGKAKAEYTSLGVSDRFNYIAYKGEHTFREDMRMKSYDWFERWFEFL